MSPCCGDYAAMLMGRLHTQTKQHKEQGCQDKSGRSPVCFGSLLVCVPCTFRKMSMTCQNPDMTSYTMLQRQASKDCGHSAGIVMILNKSTKDPLQKQKLSKSLNHMCKNRTSFLSWQCSDQLYRVLVRDIDFESQQNTESLKQE